MSFVEIEESELNQSVAVTSANTLETIIEAEKPPPPL